ncbi:hypothetical protein BRADI_3g51223v3 [Brachypodium distachyon]|uniref:Uncharacterized protein n=1 Tax=Brachypodium distachyon TaxID=15368 RepID=A0A2K2D4J2_BRADI|nr:hypothetical protein BRADI_3g51223v3 [Brachypodium distachyon]
MLAPPLKAAGALRTPAVKARRNMTERGGYNRAGGARASCMDSQRNDRWPTDTLGCSIGALAPATAGQAASGWRRSARALHACREDARGVLSRAHRHASAHDYTEDATAQRSSPRRCDQ